MSAACVIGCGDGLVDSRYRGEPLTTLRGSVLGSSDLLPSDRVRVSLFFSPGGIAVHEVSKLVEQPTSTTEAQLPFSFTLNVFDPPASELFATSPMGAGRLPYALGTLLGYADNDGNHRLSSGEPIVGVGHGQRMTTAPAGPGMPIPAMSQLAIVYAKEMLSPQVSPTGYPMPPGYHIVQAPFSCRPTPPPTPPPGANSCQVPLGASCTNDSDCGVGVCVRDFLVPWPKGACLIPDPPPAGCLPAGAVRIEDKEAKPAVAYYIQACKDDVPCNRGEPYQCELSVGGCMPTRLVSVIVSSVIPPVNFCQ